MKRILLFLMLFFSLLSIKVKGDIIYRATYHKASLSARIINLNEFPRLLFFGVNDYVSLNESQKTYQIHSDGWIKFGSFCPLSLYASSKEYIIGKNLRKVQWNTDPKILKSNVIIRSNKRSADYEVSQIHLTLKIVEVTDSSIILYIVNEVSKFKDGRPDKIVKYNPPSKNSIVNTIYL